MNALNVNKSGEISAASKLDSITGPTKQSCSPLRPSHTFTLLHEQQRFSMLCAVHTVNNLLQQHTSDQDEFDRIADELTLLERKLYVNNTVSSSNYNDTSTASSVEEFGPGEHTDTIVNTPNSSQDEPLSTVLFPDFTEKDNTMINISYFTRISLMFNNHRTPMLGNYSYEVIEVALQRRGVELSWFKIPSLDDTKRHDFQFRSDILGFVINRKVELGGKSQNVFSKIVLKNRRHWFAIIRNPNKKITPDEKSNNDRDSADCWYIVDSKHTTTVKLDSGEKLINFLLIMQQQGGNIFQAVKIGNVRNHNCIRGC